MNRTMKANKLPKSGADTIRFVREGKGTIKIKNSDIIYRENGTKNLLVTKCHSTKHAEKLLGKWEEEYNSRYGN